MNMDFNFMPEFISCNQMLYNDQIFASLGGVIGSVIYLTILSVLTIFWKLGENSCGVKEAEKTYKIFPYI